MMNQKFFRFRSPILVVSIIALSLMAARAQVAPAHDALDNFDLREAQTNPGTSAEARHAYRTRQVAGARTEAIADTMERMTAARKTLSAAVPNVRVEMNRFGNAPEIIGVEGAARFLTGDSAEPRERVAREFLAARAELFGLTTQQASGLVKTADYNNPSGNISWVEFRQEIAGIPMLRGARFISTWRTSFTGFLLFCATRANSPRQNFPPAKHWQSGKNN